MLAKGFVGGEDRRIIAGGGVCARARGGEVEGGEPHDRSSERGRLVYEKGGEGRPPWLTRALRSSPPLLTRLSAAFAFAVAPSITFQSLGLAIILEGDVSCGAAWKAWNDAPVSRSDFSGPDTPLGATASEPRLVVDVNIGDPLVGLRPWPMGRGMPTPQCSAR